MIPIEDQSVFDWIARGRMQASAHADDPAWPGITIRHLIPDVFEAYAKIFHRLDVHYENIDNPLSEEEIAILQIPACTSICSLAEKVRRRNGGTRISWREVAAFFGFPFAPGLSYIWISRQLAPTCWPRFIYGPGDGYLEAEEYTEIASLLLEEGYLPECFYRLAEIPFIATDQQLLFQGELTEVNSIPTRSNWNAPEYWWSPSNEWCLCSDYDLTFTFIGGTRSLVARILNSPSLEAIEVQPDLRVDDFAPMPAL